MRAPQQRRQQNITGVMLAGPLGQLILVGHRNPPGRHRTSPARPGFAVDPGGREQQPHTLAGQVHRREAVLDPAALPAGKASEDLLRGHLRLHHHRIRMQRRRGLQRAPEPVSQNRPDPMQGAEVVVPSHTRIDRTTKPQIHHRTQPLPREVDAPAAGSTVTAIATTAHGGRRQAVRKLPSGSRK